MPKSTSPTSSLKSLRARAGFRSAREAALAFGWPVGTYQAHERGVRKMSSEQEAKYRQAFFSRPAALSTTDPKRTAFRLAVARRLRGFRSASASVEHFNWKKSTYHSHEGGNARIDAARAKLYADAYGVSARWLVEGVRPSHLGDRFDDAFEQIKTPSVLPPYEWDFLPLIAYVDPSLPEFDRPIDNREEIIVGPMSMSIGERAVMALRETSATSTSLANTETHRSGDPVWAIDVALLSDLWKADPMRLRLVVAQTDLDETVRAGDRLLIDTGDVHVRSPETFVLGENEGISLSGRTESDAPVLGRVVLRIGPLRRQP
jgi:hypothetical protein